MTWQEYEKAVAEYFEQKKINGELHHNVFLKDIITGENRQIDSLYISKTGISDDLKIIIDAKFRNRKIDVRGVESVNSLCKAVGGSKAIIVAFKGWTKAAVLKAKHLTYISHQPFLQFKIKPCNCIY